MGNLSALLRSNWGLRRVARFSVLFKRARYGFDMSTEIDHRIVHLAAQPRSGFLPGRWQEVETKCVPYDSLRVNEERYTSLGETHQATADAVGLPGFTRLVTQHGVLIICYRQDDNVTRVWRGVYQSVHTVTLCFVAKSLIAATGSAEIPTTVTPVSLNSTFSKCYQFAVISHSHFIIRR